MASVITDPRQGISRAVEALLGLAGLAGEPVMTVEPAAVVEALGMLQRLRNVADSVEQQLVATVTREQLHEPLGYPSAAAMLVGQLHVGRSEANARVQRSEQAGPRTSLTGQSLPPHHDQTAAAQAQGTISGDHASVIVQAMVKLPPSMSTQQRQLVEAALVELAGRAVPADVAAAGRRARAVFDPDGAEPRDRQIDNARFLSVRQRDDGMGELRGRLTPEVLAKLTAVLSPLAAPRPGDANGPDPRRAGQRQHDALEDLLDRVLRSGTLPDHGGVPLTVTVLLDLDDLLTRTGQATTTHGTTIEVARLLRTATEMAVVPVVCSKADGIVAFGTTKRLASADQTRAMRARDRGCSFPDCPRPAEWCERHHIREVIAENGQTDLENMCLVCRYHHHTFQRFGWVCRMINGRPHWIPPVWIDAEQRPRRNTAHDPPRFDTAA